MNYILQIEELVSHSKVPDWAKATVANAKSWFGGRPIDSKDSTLSQILEDLKSQCIIIRNSEITGDLIPAVIKEQQLTVYSLTNQKPLLRFYFKTSDGEIIEPEWAQPNDPSSKLFEP